jgi:hypothetical protein
MDDLHQSTPNPFAPAQIQIKPKYVRYAAVHSSDPYAAMGHIVHAHNIRHLLTSTVFLCPAANTHFDQDADQ